MIILFCVIDVYYLFQLWVKVWFKFGQLVGDNDMQVIIFMYISFEFMCFEVYILVLDKECGLDC